MRPTDRGRRMVRILAGGSAVTWPDWCVDGRGVPVLRATLILHHDVTNRRITLHHSRFHTPLIRIMSQGQHACALSWQRSCSGRQTTALDTGRPDNGITTILDRRRRAVNSTRRRDAVGPFPHLTLTGGPGQVLARRGAHLYFRAHQLFVRSNWPYRLPRRCLSRTNIWSSHRPATRPTRQCLRGERRSGLRGAVLFL